MRDHVVDTMEKYLEECFRYVRNGDKKGVIQVLNDMKNFYMVENDMKIGQKVEFKEKKDRNTIPLDIDLISSESLKAIKKIQKNIQKNIQKQSINVIGKEIPDQNHVSDKPIKHIIY